MSLLLAFLNLRLELAEPSLIIIVILKFGQFGLLVLKHFFPSGYTVHVYQEQNYVQ